MKISFKAFFKSKAFVYALPLPLIACSILLIIKIFFSNSHIGTLDIPMDGETIKMYYFLPKQILIAFGVIALLSICWGFSLCIYIDEILTKTNKNMYFKAIPMTERHPELHKWVTTIDTAGEHRVYRLTEFGWNMRDMDGINSPNNNLPITHWLEEVNDPNFSA